MSCNYSVDGFTVVILICVSHIHDTKKCMGLLISTLHHLAICTLRNCSKFLVWLRNSIFTIFKNISRNLLRQPAKTMLIFFIADQTTAILETTKVRKILQGDMVKEGATVLVDFDEEEFEASVIKLHGK